MSKINEISGNDLGVFRSGLNILRGFLCGKKPLKAETSTVLKLFFDPPQGIQIAKMGLTP